MYCILKIVKLDSSKTVKEKTMGTKMSKTSQHSQFVGQGLNGLNGLNGLQVNDANPVVCLPIGTVCNTNNPCTGLITIQINNHTKVPFVLTTQGEDPTPTYTFLPGTSSQQVCNNFNYWFASPTLVSWMDPSTRKPMQQKFAGLVVGQDQNVVLSANYGDAQESFIVLTQI